MKWNFLLGLISITLFVQFVHGQVEGVNSHVESDASSFDDDGIVELDDETSKEPSQEIELNNEETEDFGDYVSPTLDKDKFFFGENFDDLTNFMENWVQSQAKKDDIDDAIAKYDGVWELESPKRQLWKNDLGLVLKSKAKHAAISSKLIRPFFFEKKPFVAQYEVTLQDGQECGGSYLKLLSHTTKAGLLTQFNDKTPYTIMFGPDKCGNDVKLHFIFRHVNPINGTITEKHCRKPKERLEEPFKDKLPHLYRLVIKPDNTYEISVDHRIVNEGSLLNDFTPSVNPPREIDDPTDEKPDNWDEREKIPDPDAKKPEDWDEDAPPKIPDPSAVKPDGWLEEEPEMIPDPNANKPEDWDVSIDGEWEAPLIDNPTCEKVVGCGEWSAPLITNPEYKGKWRAAMIENPNYQGKWSPRKILNPDFYEDLEPFKMTAISAVGIEIWSMSSEILFDNIIITDDVYLADEYASKTYDLKKKYYDKASKTLWERLMRHMNYKPEWWALYFVYVSIPVGLYIRFLRKAKKQTFLNRFITYSNENPWLWGVYILVIGTPLSFVFYSLCCASRKEEEDKTKTAKAKKTDEVSPDDEEKEIEEIEVNEEAETQEESQETASPKSKKSDLEINSKFEDSDHKIIDGEEGENEDNDNAEENDIDEAKIENVGETNRQLPSDGTRKRRPRKD